MNLRLTSLAFALTGGLLIVACTNTAAGLKEDAAKAQDSAKVAGAEAASASREAVSTAAAAVAAAVETMDIKAALIADKTIDGSRINVDTIQETQTVVLKGSVSSADQREAAGRIATAKAPGYRVDNQLTIGPR